MPSTATFTLIFMLLSYAAFSDHAPIQNAVSKFKRRQIDTQELLNEGVKAPPKSVPIAPGNWKTQASCLGHWMIGQGYGTEQARAHAAAASRRIIEGAKAFGAWLSEARKGDPAGRLILLATAPVTELAQSRDAFSASMKDSELQPSNNAKTWKELATDGSIRKKYLDDMETALKTAYGKNGGKPLSPNDALRAVLPLSMTTTPFAR
jgi:hypothetical protein